MSRGPVCRRHPSQSGDSGPHDGTHDDIPKAHNRRSPKSLLVFSSPLCTNFLRPSISHSYLQLSASAFLSSPLVTSPHSHSSSPAAPLHKRAVSQLQSAQAVFTACSIQLLPFVFRILSMPPQSTAFLQGSSASATLAQAVRFISVKLLSLFERAKAYPDSIQKRVLLVARALLR